MELARRAFHLFHTDGIGVCGYKASAPASYRDAMRMAGGTSASTARRQMIEAFIPLHPIAERILSLYNTTDDEHPVFPLPNRDALWFEIHELGVIIGKEDNLSYHQSRHSFGTFLISSDIPIESIAKMMGHSNIRTTQGYARITDDKISRGYGQADGTQENTIYRRKARQQ